MGLSLLGFPPLIRITDLSYIRVICNEFDWQVSFLAQICHQISPLLSDAEQLDIGKHGMLSNWKADDIENALWLDVLRPFINVQDLHVHRAMYTVIVPVLQTLTGVMEVLPSLRNLTLYMADSPESEQQEVRQNLKSFINTRQPPITLLLDTSPIPDSP